MANVLPYLEKMRDRFNDPVIQQKYKGFTKTLLFDFPDLKETYVLTVTDGMNPVLEKKTIPTPDISMIWSSDVFVGIQEKTVNPTSAYMSGKLKVKGKMDDLMKLQSILM
jgi:putative sterol carrier protein